MNGQTLTSSTSQWIKCFSDLIYIAFIWIFHMKYSFFFETKMTAFHHKMERLFINFDEKLIILQLKWIKQKEKKTILNLYKCWKVVKQKKKTNKQQQQHWKHPFNQTDILRISFHSIVLVKLEFTSDNYGVSNWKTFGMWICKYNAIEKQLNRNCCHVYAFVQCTCTHLDTISTQHLTKH